MEQRQLVRLALASGGTVVVETVGQAGGATPDGVLDRIVDATDETFERVLGNIRPIAEAVGYK